MFNRPWRGISTGDTITFVDMPRSDILSRLLRRLHIANRLENKTYRVGLIVDSHDFACKARELKYYLPKNT